MATSVYNTPLFFTPGATVFELTAQYMRKESTYIMTPEHKPRCAQAGQRGSKGDK